MHNRILTPVKLLLVLSLLSVSLTGCWDQLEIEDRALVLGLSIDKVAADDHVNDDQATHLKEEVHLPSIRVTAQIAIPGRVPLGPSTGDSGGTNRNPVWVVQVYGLTLDDALNNLQQEISDPHYLIHLRVIIISEEIARSNLENLNDYLRRNPEVRRRIWLLVSDGDASKFMNINPPLQRVPTLYILSMMEKAVETGKFPADYLGVFWSAESKWGESGYLPYIVLRKKENILIKGLAYFSGKVMAGATAPIEIGAYMAMKGIKPGGYSLLFQSPEFGPVVIKVNDRFSRTKVQIKNGKPHITYNVFLDSSLDEHTNSNTSIDSSQALERLDAAFQKEAKDIFNKLVKQTQLAHSDIFGMGEHVRVKAPSFWKEKIKSEHDWEQMYSDITIDIQVKTSIRRVGLNQK